MQHHASRQDHQETHRASSQAKQSVSANRNPGVYAGFKIGRKKKHVLYCVTVNCHGDNLRKKREKKHLSAIYCWLMMCQLAKAIITPLSHKQSSRAILHKDITASTITVGSENATNHQLLLIWTMCVFIHNHNRIFKIVNWEIKRNRCLMFNMKYFDISVILFSLRFLPSIRFVDAYLSYVYMVSFKLPAVSVLHFSLSQLGKVNCDCKQLQHPFAKSQPNQAC